MVRILVRKISLNYIVIFLAAFMALILGVSNNNVLAATAVNDTTTVTIRSSCSMTATVTSEHTATMMGGTYSGTSEYPNGIGNTTIQTFCNDANGYAIYAIGYTNNEEGNTVLKGGTGLTSSDDIVTGTATSGSSNNDVSNWAMKVSAVSNAYTPTIMNGFGSFSAVPSSYTEVAKLDRHTDSASGTNIGSTITTTYAAYISNSQPAGTYTGQVKYVLVHPDYNVPSARIMQNIAEWEDELLPEVQVTAVDSRDNKTYYVSKMKDGNIWMTQNLDLCIGCSGTAALTSENTDLNEYDTNGDGTGTTFAGYSINNGIITWTPTGSTMTGTPATITDFSYTSSPSSSVSNWAGNNTAPSMAEGKDTIVIDENAYYETTTENNITATALQKCINAGEAETFCRHNHVGNYYNFTAAVAMNNTSAYTTQYTVMPNSICPAGWRLPKGLTQTGSTVNISEFNNLLNIYGVAGGDDSIGNTNVTYATGGFAKLTSSPLYYARAGGIRSTTLYVSGSYGLYWYSTLASDAQAYSLNFNSNALYPANLTDRSVGRPVRCVHEPTTMQSVSKADLNTLMPVIGDTKKLRDNRDNTEYTIGKLADGNYWMLDNLALDPATMKSDVVIDSSNSNIANGTTFTLPESVSTDFARYTEPRINTEYKNNSVNLALEQSGTSKVGVYYNYCAATAGTYCKSQDHTDTDDAEYDICPKGWRMPTGGTNGEYQILKNEYSIANFVLALRVPYSALYSGYRVLTPDVTGGFWAKTYGTSSENMHGLWASISDGLRPANTHDRKFGFPIRCIYDR